MFIGRWQPWHAGHRWLIDQRLNEGKNVLICIRDVEPDENNPFTPQEVLMNIHHELHDEFHPQLNAGNIKVIIIPDIESINYGRGVGYEVIEHVPPANIHEISATKIREKFLDENGNYKSGLYGGDGSFVPTEK